MAERHSQIKKHLVLIIIAMCFFISDRILKTIALNLVIKKPLLGNWFAFSLMKNTNAAFSLTFGFDILWLTSIIIIGIIIWFIISLKQNKLFTACFLLIILLGAFSNLYDRIIFGSVIDYLEIFNLNIFNLADVLIVGGAVLLATKELKKPTE